jgi:hypothetical protein
MQGIDDPMHAVKMFEDTSFRDSSSRYHLCLSYIGVASALRCSIGQVMEESGEECTVVFALILRCSMGHIMKEPGEQCTVVFA